ncbi:hypothetical protein NW757_007708 [Fusarium falciforme]|nr:hypothetical protein NW757_007708 [Fusarium falciforme]
MEYKSASQGAATFLVAALDPALQAHNGAYVDDCQVAESTSDHVQDAEVADRLWMAAERMTGLTF